MRKNMVLAAMRSQRMATLAALRALAPPDWERVTAAGASVRDQVARLIALEEGLARGRYLLAMRTARTPDDLMRWCEARSRRYRDRTPEELVAAAGASGARAARICVRLPVVAWRVRWRGPLGRQPLARVLCRLVFLDWQAEHDVRDCLSAPPTPLDPVRATALSVAVEAALPAVILPRVERTAGVLRVVVETGSDTRKVFGVDFARKQYGPRITAPPDATIRFDAAAFVVTAAGRRPWRTAPPGAIRIEGNEDLATAFLGALHGGG